jgi:toxin CcdB
VQFDVFVNPIVAARRAYPYVIVLQSDFAQGATDQIVAPAVPRESLSKISGRLTPVVMIETSEHVVLVPALTGLRRGDLGPRVGSLAAQRGELLAAIDFLFFGV